MLEFGRVQDKSLVRVHFGLLRTGEFIRHIALYLNWRFQSSCAIEIISGKFRRNALALTPFVVRFKQKPIKVRSTDTVSAYKRGRSYGALEVLGTILLQTGTVLTYLLN